MVENDESGREPASGSAGPGTTGPRVSSRVPQTIEGKATEVRPAGPFDGAPNPPPESQVNPDAAETSLEAADAPLASEVPHPASPEGPVTDSPMPGEVQAAEAEVAARDPEPTTDAPRRGRGSLIAGLLVALLVVLGLAWLFADGGYQMLTNRFGKPQGADTAKTSAAPAEAVMTASAPSSQARTPTAPDAPSKPVDTRKAEALAPASVPQAKGSEPASLSALPKPASESEQRKAEQRKPEPTPLAASNETRRPEAAAPFATPAPATSAPAEPAPVKTSTSASDVAPKFADIDRRLSDLDSRIAAFSNAPAKPAAETTAALAAQSTRLGRIEDTLSSLDKVRDTLAALDKRVGALEQKLDAPKAATRVAEAPDVDAAHASDAAARTVVAQNLLAAVQSGTPFAPQVAALRSLGAEETSLSKLAASAEAGVPTLAQLRDRFAALRPKLRAQPKSDPDANWRDQLTARLSSLVSIHPAGERAGASPDAVASRAEAALARGDIAVAVNEMRSLPPSDAALAKDWIDAATRRTDAEAEARALLAASLASLAKPKS